MSSVRRPAPLRTLLLPATAALALSLMLGACSGDDDEKPGSGDESSMSAEEQEKAEDAARREAELLGAQERPCQVKASATGAVEASWKGRGIVRTPGSEDTGDNPEATYVSTKGPNQLSVYSVGEGFDNPAITYTNGDTTYSASDGSGELDVKKNGTGAVIDVELSGIKGETVQLQATYTCPKAEPRGKNKSKNNGKDKDKNKKG